MAIHFGHACQQRVVFTPGEGEYVFGRAFQDFGLRNRRDFPKTNGFVRAGGGELLAVGAPGQ